MSLAAADLKPRKAWRVWRKVLAYLILIGLASVSIWVIDRDAMRATYFWDAGPASSK